MREERNIAYRAEVMRKGIHLMSLSIPIIYYFISKAQALQILIPVTSAFLAVDVLRYYHRPTSDLFYLVFRFMLRKHEQDHSAKRLNGATNVLIAATLCVLLFPKIIVITAFSILIISDSMAALIGRRYGRHRFLTKSLEGSTAFFISAVLVILVTPKLSGSYVEYIIGITGAFVGTLFEAASMKIDDNLSIPLSIGAVMWGLYATFLPALDLFGQNIPF